jgi:hypothetical protein
MKKLRGKLQEDAYTDAKDMIGSVSNLNCGFLAYFAFHWQIKDIHSTPELKDALRKYANSKFQEVFGFNHTDSAPPGFEGGAGTTFVHNDALKYIQDDVDNNRKLEDFIDKDYFGLVFCGMLITENVGC